MTSLISGSSTWPRLVPKTRFKEKGERLGPETEANE